MGYPVNSPTELSAYVGSTVIRDLSTALQTVNLPTGAKWVQLSYRLLPGATGVTNQFAKCVVNSANDSEATGKLGVDGASLPIFQGDDIAIAADATSYITRLDFITEAAVGAEKTALRIVWGV